MSGGLDPPSSPSSPEPSPSPEGFRLVLMHPTLVSLKNANTASVLRILSFRWGPIAACPDMSWQYWPATDFRA